MPDPSDRERTEREEKGLSSLAEGYRKAAPFMAASTTLVVSVGGGAWLGHWLDGKLGHQTPWMLLLGAGIGMVGGFISFFRTVLASGKKDR